MFLWGEKVEGEKYISAQGWSVKGSSQQSSTSGLKVKGGPLFSGLGPLIMGVGKRYYTGTRKLHAYWENQKKLYVLQLTSYSSNFQRWTITRDKGSSL